MQCLRVFVAPFGRCSGPIAVTHTRETNAYIILRRGKKSTIVNDFGYRDDLAIDLSPCQNAVTTNRATHQRATRIIGSADGRKSIVNFFFLVVRVQEITNYHRLLPTIEEHATNLLLKNVTLCSVTLKK